MYFYNIKILKARSWAWLDTSDLAENWKSLFMASDSCRIVQEWKCSKRMDGGWMARST